MTSKAGGGSSHRSDWDSQDGNSSLGASEDEQEESEFQEKQKGFAQLCYSHSKSVSGKSRRKNGKSDEGYSVFDKYMKKQIEET